MKRTWLPYVAVIAALVAGSIVSSAFAGPPSFKFGGNSGSGGSSFRSLGGSNNNNGSSNNGSNLSRRIGSLPLQNGNSNSSSGGSMQSQIKKFQGNLNGNIGQAIGGNSNNSTPRVTIKPGNLGNIGQAIGNGNSNNSGTPRIGISQGNIINQIKKNGNVSGLPGIVGGGNGNGNGQGLGNAIPKIGKIDPGFNKNGNGNIGQAIGQAILGGGNGNSNANCHKDIHCSPIKVGCKPWWWDCHHFHHDHCYKPVYPVCTQTIVVQVPVVVDQVAVAQPVMQVPVGSTLTLQSPGLGAAAGQVMLQIDKVAVPAMVNEWTMDAVTTTLPMLGLGGQVFADIVMVRADGSVANSIKVELINAQPQTAQAAAVGAVQPASFQADQGGAAAALGGLSQ
jgi:hypothetical protein